MRSKPTDHHPSKQLVKPEHSVFTRRCIKTRRAIHFFFLPSSALVKEWEQLTSTGLIPFCKTAPLRLWTRCDTRLVFDDMPLRSRRWYLFFQKGLCTLRQAYGSQQSMEAILACDQALTTDWPDWVATSRELWRLFKHTHTYQCAAPDYGRRAHFPIVSTIQLKPFWLATQLYPQNVWTGWQNGVNDDVCARAPFSMWHVRGEVSLPPRHVQRMWSRLNSSRALVISFFVNRVLSKPHL